MMQYAHLGQLRATWQARKEHRGRCDTVENNLVGEYQRARRTLSIIL